MTATFTRQRAYRYYICDCAQLPVAAADLEPALVGGLEPLLGSGSGELLVQQSVQRVTYDSRSRQVSVELRDTTRFEFRLPEPNRRGARSRRSKPEGRIPRVSHLMALGTQVRTLGPREAPSRLC